MYKLDKKLFQKRAESRKKSSLKDSRTTLAGYYRRQSSVTVLPSVKVNFFQASGVLNVVTFKPSPSKVKRFVFVKDGFLVLYSDKELHKAAMSKEELKVEEIMSVMQPPELILDLQSCMFDVTSQIPGGKGFEILHPRYETLYFEAKSKKKVVKWLNALQVGSSITIKSGIKAQDKVTKKDGELSLLAGEEAELRSKLEEREKKKEKSKEALEKVVEKNARFLQLLQFEKGLEEILCRLEGRVDLEEKNSLETALNDIRALNQ
eukprot:snap_masked-scaffold_20-processed-gene-2.33-mRNA-1 protein AED:1.00 eAED:1.00 QI:0/-1/0/0/-1/1/1/0/262